MSLTQEVCRVVSTRRGFYSLKSNFLLRSNKISPFALNFERRNFADVVYAQTATLHTTKVRKVNSYSTTPLKKITEHKRFRFLLLQVTSLPIYWCQAVKSQYVPPTHRMALWLLYWLSWRTAFINQLNKLLS